MNKFEVHIVMHLCIKFCHKNLDLFNRLFKNCGIRFNNENSQVSFTSNYSQKILNTL